MKPTPPVAQGLVDSFMSIDPNGHVGSTKKKDASDTYLGTLSPTMQKMFIAVLQRRVELEDLIQHVCDLVSGYELDIRQHGDNLPKKTVQDFNTKLDGLVDRIGPLGTEYKILNGTFWEILASEMKPLDGKPYLGIRDGFDVVCRSVNNRGDNDCIFCSLFEALRKVPNPYAGLKSSIQIAFVVLGGKKDEKAPPETPAT